MLFRAPASCFSYAIVYTQRRCLRHAPLRQPLLLLPFMLLLPDAADAAACCLLLFAMLADIQLLLFAFTPPCRRAAFAMSCRCCFAPCHVIVYVCFDYAATLCCWRGCCAAAVDAAAMLLRCCLPALFAASPLTTARRAALPRVVDAFAARAQHGAQQMRAAIYFFAPLMYEAARRQRDDAQRVGERGSSVLYADKRWRYRRAAGGGRCDSRREAAASETRKVQQCACVRTLRGAQRCPC